MKLLAILREVSDQQSREMVTGIADILRDVKDKSNREEIAKRMIKKFDREGVKYDAKEFMKLVGIAADKLQEIGFTKKSDFGFPYKRVTGAENTAMFEFDTSPDVELTEFEDKIKKEVLDKLRAAGYNTLKSVLTAEKEELLRRADMDKSTYAEVMNVLQKEKSDLGNEYQVWVQREENDGFQQGWILSIAFAVLEKADRSRSFEKEVNDPKNIYKVMNTVVNIAKEEAARLEKAGQEVIRVEFEPTKRKEDPKDERRANLYLAYLKKEFPDAEIKSTKNKGKIWVNL